MRIKSVRHKALKRLFLQDDPKGLPAECVDKLRAILTFLQEMRSPKTLRTFPFCSLHVNRNRPLTFKRRTMKSPISILNITINEDAMRMLNPVHPGFRKIVFREAEALNYDPRMFAPRHRLGKA